MNTGETDAIRCMLNFNFCESYTVDTIFSTKTVETQCSNGQFPNCQSSSQKVTHVVDLEQFGLTNFIYFFLQFKDSFSDGRQGRVLVQVIHERRG